MFLKAGFLTACLAVIFASGGAHADARIPGLQQQTYKLKSLSKSIKGRTAESKADRANFCGEQLNPKVRVEDGVLNVELNAGNGFEWREFSEAPGELSEGCRYSASQKIQGGRDQSVLILLNGEECVNGNAAVGSQRDTWVLKNHEIVYQVEAVSKDAKGIWRADPSKESFTCIWALAK